MHYIIFLLKLIEPAASLMLENRVVYEHSYMYVEINGTEMNIHNMGGQRRNLFIRCNSARHSIHGTKTVFPP